MKQLILLTVLLLGSQFLHAQSYPEDREKFVKALQAATNDYLNGDQKDFLKKELATSLVEGTAFPNDYFKQMVATCTLMETKRLKPYPEIYNYVFSVYSFVKNKQPSSSFTAWHGSVDKLLDARNIKKFEDFIELSAGFFSENRIAESSNFKWYFYGAYVFEVAGDKPTIRLTDGRLVCGVPNRDANDKKDARFIDSLVQYKRSLRPDSQEVGRSGREN